MADVRPLEDWKPTEESSRREYFHMTAPTSKTLADLVPPGPARTRLRASSRTFQSYAKIEDPVGWFAEPERALYAAVERLVPVRHPV